MNQGLREHMLFLAQVRHFGCSSWHALQRLQVFIQLLVPWGMDGGRAREVTEPRGKKRAGVLGVTGDAREPLESAYTQLPMDW